MEPAPTARSSRGVLLMIGATLAFTAMVGFVRVARQDLSTIEVMAWRGAVALPLAAGLAWRPGFQLINQRVFALRAALGFFAMYSFYTAAKGLSLADMTLITRTQPILLALLAPVVLGRSERPPRRIWVLLVLGVVGTAVLIAPDLQVGSTWALWAILATVFSAGAHLAVRKLGQTDHPAAIVFWFQAVVVVIGFGALWAGGGVSVPAPALWPWLVGAGVAATAGQILMTSAYRAEKAAVVGAASYTGPVWGVAGDAVFFATLPGLTELIGGGIIVAAGLWLVLGERRSRGAVS
jgi:drug/metabolite transporter (DMT)-like permease